MKGVVWYWQLPTTSVGNNEYQIIYKGDNNMSLQELIADLIRNYADPTGKENAYRNLEAVGIDRTTATVLAKEFIRRYQKARA